ncbi:MAG TPA: DoxX family protein [Chitinophagaceae bacterium]
MQPKTIKVLYWVFTILFAALMIFSSYSSILLTDDAKKLIHDQLGYPVYFIRFTGFAKLIGAVVILIPGLDKIKEWAYAGLFFDLIAAVYSGIALSGTVDPMMAFMLVWFVPGILSYIFWKKTMTLTATPNVGYSPGAGRGK